MTQEQVEQLEVLQGRIMEAAGIEARASAEVLPLESDGPGTWPPRGSFEQHGDRLATALDALREERAAYRTALYAVQQAAIDRGERLREELLHEVAIIAKQ